MKKSIIGVIIHKEGNANQSILKAIGKHNGGENVIDRATLEGYIMGQKVEYPNLFKNLKIIDAGIDQHISEDGGETCCLTLTWKEVEELKETISDLPAEVFTGAGTF